MTTLSIGETRRVDPHSWGRFTAFGSDRVEAELRDIVGDVVAALEPNLRHEPVRCLALIGGYGRGEGGVETTASGEERPHNNLDFLLIGNRAATPETMSRLKSTLDPLLHRLSEKYGIGLD
ncbi:MAG: hypothetical protein OHK0029_12430 [Armatimonadaceae bacterium]